MMDRIDNALEKAGGKAEELKGRGKQAAGDETGDERMRDEGRADEATGKAKQVVGEMKDKVKDFTDKLKN